MRIFKSINTDKQNSIIQIIGLVLGIVTCIFVCKYVFFEYSFDRFHKDNSLIYRTQNSVARPLGSLAKEKLNFVEDYTQLHPCYRGITVNIEDKSFYENEVFFTDGSLFKIFTFPVISGDAIKILNLKNHMAISENYAEKYFGNENPIGKTLLVNGAYESNITYTVGAVFENIPQNSHVQFNMLLSMENILANNMYSNDEPWRWSNFFTYFKTKNPIDKELFGKTISELANANGAREYFDRDTNYSVYSLNELHLNGQNNFIDHNHDAQYVNIRILIALIIMVMAWLNFISISIGSALKNKMELGVKKVLGASLRRLWFELFQKILIVNGIALVISIAAYELFSLALNKMGMEQIILPQLYLSLFWFTLISILIVGAFLVSQSIHRLQNRQKLITILTKNTSKAKGKQSPWITLFVIQFGASIVLIAFTLTSSKQVNELMHVNPGIQTDQIFAIQSANSAQEGDIKTARTVFEEEVLKISGVTTSTSSSYLPGGYIPSFMPTRLSYQTQDENVSCRMNFVGYNYIPLFKHKLLAGRNFSEEYASDANGVIINETLAKAYGFSDVSEALGKEIFWESRNESRTIIGVMCNFYQQSADMPIEPTMFQLWNQARGYCLLNIETSNTKATIAAIEALWKKVHPRNAFNYLWVDEHYNMQFKKWIDYSFIVKTFSLVAIFIACVGLFGLSSMLLNKKNKEIGIRKVNGAKVSEILQILNKDYIKWVSIAFMLATPLSYFAMNKWLQNFAFKTELNWWIFALAGFIALAIALITVSWQTFRAARRNLVEALRYE
ncbi:MAG: ABC transporter permease [Salinivirgaceae bacterium]|jgi:putative ABC transport system permease protein|nr:ABC transporter permease [Salinivirgaceae bacterium]